MWRAISIVCIAGLLYNLSASQNWSDAKDEFLRFPDNDLWKFLRNIQARMGLDEKGLKRSGRRFSQLVHEAQLYTARDFDRDWAKVRDEPSIWNVIDFIKKTSWPALVNSCLQITKVFTQVQKFLLKFLEKKCDKYLGRDNMYHPWKILKHQDKTNVAFLVFVYILSLSLPLFKLLSWWNLTVYFAITFLLYYLGGPYLVFNWLLTLSAIFWFLFDVIIQNPLQVSLVVIFIYILNIMKNFVSSEQTTHMSSQQNVAGPPTSQRRTRTRVVEEDEERRPAGSAASNPDREEFSFLVERIDSMEMKTNLLYTKLDSLTKALEKISPDDL